MEQPMQGEFVIPKNTELMIIGENQKEVNAPTLVNYIRNKYELSPMFDIYGEIENGIVTIGNPRKSKEPNDKSPFEFSFSIEEIDNNKFSGYKNLDEMIREASAPTVNQLLEKYVTKEHRFSYGQFIKLIKSDPTINISDDVSELEIDEPKSEEELEEESQDKKKQDYIDNMNDRYNKQLKYKK